MTTNNKIDTLLSKLKVMLEFSWTLINQQDQCKLDVLAYNHMKKNTLDLQEKLGNMLALCTLFC
jgi:hypothetical protein